MLMLANVAIPADAASVAGPDSTAPLGPVPAVMVSVTSPVKVVATLPSESCALSCSAGAIGVPAASVPGSTAKARCVGGPATMPNLEPEPELRAPDVACSRYPNPDLSMLRFVNLATPPTALTVVVPLNVPLPGLRASERVTGSAKLETRLPLGSRASITTAGVMIAPAVVLPAPTLNASWEATGGGPVD